MSDVKYRVINSHRLHMDKIGVSFPNFMRRLQTLQPDEPFFKVTDFENPSNRVPWNTYVFFLRELDRVMDEAGHPNWTSELIPIILGEQDGFFPFRSAASILFWNASIGYRFINMVLGPAAFGRGVIASTEDLSDGRIQINLELAPGYDGSIEFFQLCEVGFRLSPTVAKLEESIVESKLGPRQSTYLITPPPSVSPVTKLWRLLRLPFATMRVIQELAQQDRALRLHYSRLVKSELELQETQRLLEKRVEERTRELEEANVALRAQIAEILARREENRDLTDRLHQLQKIEAVGTLVGGISHEINNVLHGTFLSIDLAERALPADHPARERVLMAKRFTKRGQALMKQILAFSRKSRLELKPVSLLPAIEDAIELMRSTLPKMITVEVDTENYDPETAVLSDATQLQQVMINLASNAAYAMRKNGGRLKITLVKRPEDTNVRLTVSDTGEGMDENVQSRVFEPFFTTKPLGEGTGVGLSVVHGIITAHGGSIAVKSAPGQGAEFTIVLSTVPLVLNDDDFADLEHIGGSEKILVVDDEVELVSLLKDTLGAFGYDVTTATSADEAMKIIANSSFDLVLTDYSMPGRNGLDLAREIKRREPRTKVILSTGYRDLFGSDSAMDVVDAKVSKPLDALSLNREIRACLSLSQATPVVP